MQARSAVVTLAEEGPSVYARAKLVSFPDPHVCPPEKRVWNLSQDFLALLSQHVRKTGKPIRTQDSKQSCGLLEHRSVPIPIARCIRSHWNRPVRPKHVLNYVIVPCFSMPEEVGHDFSKSCDYV